MKKQKENSPENITWSEMGKQNVQAKEVYLSQLRQDNADKLDENRASPTLYDTDKPSAL